MINWYNWNFPAKLLPKWVVDERKRNCQAIIKQDEVIKELQNILSECLDDMGNTLIPNQRNLDGSHPFHKDEEPQGFYIGTTIIHQDGLNVSLKLWHKAKKVLADSFKKIR